MRSIFLFLVVFVCSYSLTLILSLFFGTYKNMCLCAKKTHGHHIYRIYESRDVFVWAKKRKTTTTRIIESMQTTTKKTLMWAIFEEKNNHRKYGITTTKQPSKQQITTPNQKTHTQKHHIEGVVNFENWEIKFYIWLTPNGQFQQNFTRKPRKKTKPRKIKSSRINFQCVCLCWWV